MKQGIALWLLLLTIDTASAQNLSNSPIELIRPSADETLTNNMPVLAWQALEGHHYEVWIDEIKMISGLSENWFIPFPLSYGEHQWKVIAVRGDKRVSSQTASFAIEGVPLSALPENAVLLRNNWKVISSLLTEDQGAQLSKKQMDVSDWKNTSLPATALSVMVRNGLYPNPYVATNNMQIPDLSEEFNEKYKLLQYSHIAGKNPWLSPYWYRKTFVIPEDYAGKKIWLTLGEINYRAEVWLNGKLLADTAKVVGMERFFRFDISSIARQEKENTLAIAIYPPDHPGTPADAPLTPLAAPGLNMADGQISHDYTKWDVLGWDWQPAIRDRDMGITEEVYVHATDHIELDNLYVTSDLPLPSRAFADISLSADLINHSSTPKSGMLQINITREEQIIEVVQAFSLAPFDTLDFLWTPANNPQLRLKNPELWWPHGYGEPALYKLSMVALASDEAARKEIQFGIREVESYMGSNERVYKVNGQEIYCKGGNWVLDMMLNWTASRYEQEILLSKHANLNMLRVWGPTGAPPDVFYEAADRNGILIWQDFLNDYWGTFRNTPGMSPEESLFEKASIQLVKRYRNHPSLIIWCGGNEGPNPREDLIMKKILPQYDGRDSKHYLRISNGDGLHGGGPYHTLLPEAYLSEAKLSGFSSEIGPSGVPEFESVKRFMPHPGESWKPGRFPIDGVWAYHDAINFPGGDMRKFTHYDDLVRSSYGIPDSTLAGVESYLDRCQLLNYDVYRACFEAINSQLWDNSSGILLWKSNSSWPSMVWQVYDWYLQAHAGFYGTRKAAAPQTVQYNRKSHRLEVLNASRASFDQSSISAVLYDENLSKVWESTKSFNLGKNSVYELDSTVPLSGDKLCYLTLELHDSSGAQLADNFYWLHTRNDFKQFNDIAEALLEIETRRKETMSQSVQYSVTISNAGSSIALMTRLKLVDPISGLELLPSFWSDNYLSLLPGESKTVFVEVSSDNLPDDIALTLKSYNMKHLKSIKLKMNDL